MLNFEQFDFVDLSSDELITTAYCSCCHSEWQIYIDGLFSELDERRELQLVNLGYVISECEDCYYQSFFVENIDDGKYSPIDVYGIGGLVR